SLLSYPPPPPTLPSFPTRRSSDLNLLVLDLVEILLLFPDFVRVPQRHPEQAFTARLERHDMLARGEDNSAERHHALLANRLADRSEEHTSELQSLAYLVCRLLLEK